MTLARWILVWSVFSSSLSAVAASDVALRDPAGAARSITVSITRDGARFAALGAIAETRLEVIGPDGGPVFNSGFQPGNVRDWRPQTDSTRVILDGEYVCFVTARSVGGAVTMKQGRLQVAGGQLALELGDAEDVGGVARESAPPEERLAPTAEGQGAAMVVTAHDGDTGQITATSGDLTLRTGDFFAGEDEERMRVTADGRVGIGTGKPEATLDVAGTIRAKGGVQFSDGTTIDSSDGKLSVKTADGETFGPTSVTGTGTQDRLAKWAETGGAGTLTDSAVTESSGKVGIGVGTPTQVLHVFGKSLFQNTGTASLFILDRTDGKIVSMGAAGSSSTLAYDNSGIFKIESNSRANIARGAFGELNGATTRFSIDGFGFIGVGVTDGPYGKVHLESADNYGPTLYVRSRGVEAPGVWIDSPGEGVIAISSKTGVYARSKAQSGRALSAECDFVNSCQAGYFIGSVYVQGSVTATSSMYAASFVQASDRDAKTGFAAVEPRAVLRRVASIPVQTWVFKDQPSPVRHMGPMAQDFRAAFGLGADDKHIATVDADGVLMASIQGLYEIVQEKEKEIEELRDRLARVEGRTAASVRP